MDIKKIIAEYHQSSDDRKKGIETLLEHSFNSLSETEQAEVQQTFLECLDNKLREADNLIREVNLKFELEHISKYVSIAYIAKRFFGKSRQWFNNRLKENIVNGKPVKFSSTELTLLSSHSYR